jgi:hypothetical protein
MHTEKAPDTKMTCEPALRESCTFFRSVRPVLGIFEPLLFFVVIQRHALYVIFRNTRTRTHFGGWLFVGANGLFRFGFFFLQEETLNQNKWLTTGSYLCY